MVQHELYDSIEELLAPHTLRKLTVEAIQVVRYLPFNPSRARSGSQLLAIGTDSRDGPRFVLKRTGLARDWIMRSSGDSLCRSVTLWQSGLLERLKPTIEDSILACARDEDGWAILMEDVSEGIIGDEQPLTTVQHQGILDAMAALHATFWESAEVADSALGLCDCLAWHTPFLIQTVAKEASSISQSLLEGWPLLLTCVEPDVAEVLERLMANPTLLCHAYERLPFTLVHGDWKSANLSLSEQPRARLALLDWQLATYGPATLDLGWYLGLLTNKIVMVPEEISIEYYRQSLARRLGNRFDEAWWQPMLALGLLGNVLRHGSSHAWVATHDPNERNASGSRVTLQSFNQQVRSAVKWL